MVPTFPHWASRSWGQIRDTAAKVGADGVDCSTGSRATTPGGPDLDFSVKLGSISWGSAKPGILKNAEPEKGTLV
ncbi:unnamed protein product [Effrenium voratum]|nr:unnamed protein product [Effrenium voratum]